MKVVNMTKGKDDIMTNAISFVQNLQTWRSRKEYVWKHGSETEGSAKNLSQNLFWDTESDKRVKNALHCILWWVSVGWPLLYRCGAVQPRSLPAPGCWLAYNDLLLYLILNLLMTYHLAPHSSLHCSQQERTSCNGANIEEILVTTHDEHFTWSV